MEDAYEDIDCRRMWGVFDANGYSPDPIAVFRSEQMAAQWLAWDKSRGDDSAVCCEPCICAVDNIIGRMWNSTEPPPEAP